MLRASAAQDSPRRKAGWELTLGCVEKREETAQTARIRTGGRVSALLLLDYVLGID
jgi:hypothetical protein